MTCFFLRCKDRPNKGINKTNCVLLKLFITTFNYNEEFEIIVF